MSDEANTGAAAAGAADASAATGKAAEKTVPYDRFQTVVTQKNTLAAEVEASKAELQRLTERLATTDTLAQALEAEKAARLAVEQRYQRYAVGVQHGITDPDLLAFAELKHSGLPADGRPDFGEWLTALKAKPEDAPAPLRLVWQPPAAAPAAAPPAAAPAANAGTVPAAPLKDLTADTIRGMTTEQYRAWRKANGIGR